MWTTRRSLGGAARACRTHRPGTGAGSAAGTSAARSGSSPRRACAAGTCALLGPSPRGTPPAPRSSTTRSCHSFLAPEGVPNPGGDDATEVGDHTNGPMPSGTAPGGHGHLAMPGASESRRRRTSCPRAVDALRTPQSRGRLAPSSHRRPISPRRSRFPASRHTADADIRCFAGVSTGTELPNQLLTTGSANLRRMGTARRARETRCA